MIPGDYDLRVIGRSGELVLDQLEIAHASEHVWNPVIEEFATLRV